MLLLWALTYRQADTTWALDVASDFRVVNQYANVLPVMLGSPSAGIAASVSYTSVLVNGAVAAVGLTLWRWITTTGRFDFYAR